MGIFLAAGPHIRAGKVEGLHIADVAPTILYNMGAAVPEAMDGAVRSDLFEATYVAEHPVERSDVESPAR